MMRRARSLPGGVGARGRTMGREGIDVRQQRVEAGRKLGSRRWTADRWQPVKGVGAGDDAAAPGGVPVRTSARTRRLGAAVAEENPVQAGRLAKKRLREQARQRDAVELGPAASGVQRSLQA